MFMDLWTLGWVCLYAGWIVLYQVGQTDVRLGELSMIRRSGGSDSPDMATGLSYKILFILHIYEFESR